MGCKRILLRGVTDRFCVRRSVVGPLIAATFEGASIEVWGGDLSAHGLDVTDIRMAGATTTVTLMSSGAKALH